MAFKPSKLHLYGLYSGKLSTEGQDDISNSLDRHPEVIFGTVVIRQTNKSEGTVHANICPDDSNTLPEYASLALGQAGVTVQRMLVIDPSNLL